MSRFSADSVRVLAVDDGSAACELAHSFLESAGYRLEVVNAASALLAAFARASAQVVLLAGLHDGPSTLALLRQLRELPGGGAAALVIISAENDEDLERRAFDMGADDSWAFGLSRTEWHWRVRSLLRLKERSPRLQPTELLRSQRDSMMELHQQREETLALLVHDMKNPLSGVISNAEFLNASTDLDPDQQSSAQDILQASRRLHRMVLSLLDVSLSEQGQLAPTFEALDVRTLLGETRATCSGRLRDKAIALQLLVPAVLPPLHGDRDMLLRIFANLIDNAIGASSAGSSIELLVTVDAQAFEFCVSDQGPEREERAQLLYELTREAETPQARPRQRRGLGLRACRVLTEVHDGQITIEARQPHGTSVRVRLPRSM